MSVSVIASNFNGAQYLPKLLDSLLAQEGVEKEIIIVDRNSSDESPEILAKYPEIQVISEAPESGLVTGYDCGVPHAKFEHYFFCNEDMWFEPDCLRRLEEVIDVSAKIGASDPWQWTYDAEHWIHGGVKFNRRRWDVNSPFPFRFFNATIDSNHGDITAFPCAGALLIHRELYEEVGGWDRSFFLDDEDVDFFIRAWQRGWKSVTVPEAKVYHAVSVSHGNTLKVNDVTISVGQRRYVSTCSNKSIIALKYFSFPSVLLCFFTWFARLANNVVKGRLKWARYDLFAGAELIRRIPQALKFRRANKAWNSQKPGEQFFLTSEFQE